MGLYSRGLNIGRIFASVILGGLFSGGLIFFFGGEGDLLSDFYGICVRTAFENQSLKQSNEIKFLAWCLPP